MAIMRRQNRDADDFYEAVPANRQAGYDQPVATAGSRVGRMVYFVASVIQVILGLRLILRLLGASTASAFVDFIYGLSAPLVRPFAGIFNLPIENDVARFEVATVFAMIVYAVVAYMIVLAISAARGRDIDN